MGPLVDDPDLIAFLTNARRSGWMLSQVLELTQECWIMLLGEEMLKARKLKAEQDGEVTD